MNNEKKPTLSKSRFLAGLQCPKRLYLESHQRSLATPPSAFQKRIFDNGHTVGELARTWFPEGKLIEATFSETDRALEETRKAIQEGVSTLFEAAFFARATFIRADVLTREEDSSWTIIEVKSTTTVQDIHVIDLGVQRYVTEQSGLAVKATRLMHLNRECRFPDLSNLFTQTDVTEKVKDKTAEIASTIDSYLGILSSKAVPKTPIGPHCFHPYLCPFKDHCWKGVKEPSIFSIPKLHPSRARELISKGIRSICEIPANYPLSDTQGRFVSLVQGKQSRILWPAIKDQLAQLVLPLYFLDLQTQMDTIPRLNGLRPFDQYPYMFSLHKLGPDKRLDQTGYVHADDSDPRPVLAQSLCNEIGPDGTIIVFQGSLERRTLKNLAWDISPFRQELLAMVDHTFDLASIFRDYYFNPCLVGSPSLKDVASALLKDLPTGHISIKDQDEARLAWMAMISTESEEEKPSLMKALNNFGFGNSFAMMLIYTHLVKGSAQAEDFRPVPGNGTGR